MQVIILNLWRAPILWLLWFSLNEAEKELLRKDILASIQWEEWIEYRSMLIKILYEMSIRKSTRSILYFRAKRLKIRVRLCKIFWKESDNIELYATEIGAGITIPHNNVIFYAMKIGKNCHICPGVVCGQIRGGGFPTFGDDVLIGANAVVIGDIKIGNNVKIGAGAVITKNVPDNCTVIGNPMRIIETIDL